MRVVYVVPPAAEHPDIVLRVMHDLMDAYYFPVCGQVFQRAIDRRHMMFDKWLEWEKEVLTRCDVVLKIPGPCWRADLLVEHALDIGRPVYYSLQQIQVENTQRFLSHAITEAIP